MLRNLILSLANRIHKKEGRVIQVVKPIKGRCQSCGKLTQVYPEAPHKQYTDTCIKCYYD